MTPWRTALAVAIVTTSIVAVAGCGGVHRVRTSTPSAANTTGQPSSATSASSKALPPVTVPTSSSTPPPVGNLDVRGQSAPKTPVLILVPPGADFSSYTPPDAPNGPLTITGIKGEVVSVKDSSGGTESFNLSTRSWG